MQFTQPPKHQSSKVKKQYPKISPSLNLIIGPMYAGKTTELLRRLNIYQEFGFKTLYVSSSLDSRSNLPFSTHNPLLKSIGKIDSIKVKNLFDVNFEQYNVIGIDEGQFFSDLKNYVTSSINKGLCEENAKLERESKVEFI